MPYPGDAILVIDHAGEIIASSSPAERLVCRLVASGRDATDALRRISVEFDMGTRATTGAARTDAQEMPSRSVVRDATHPLSDRRARPVVAFPSRGVECRDESCGELVVPGPVAAPAAHPRGPSSVRYTMDAPVGRSANRGAGTDADDATDKCADPETFRAPP